MPLVAGTWRLSFRFIGYTSLDKTVKVNTENLDLGNILLQPETQVLEDMVVYGKHIMMQMKGDTIEYNASALRLAPDATLEDLLKKLSGVQVNSKGEVKAQGEKVLKITIDGKSFFGNDALIALRNLPAYMVDKIQVFDKKSDQAEMTGFEDGERNKTINVVTKKDKNHGYFGRIYGGYGSNERYEGGGNVNFYQGKRRFSVLGMANNLSNTSFSSDDLKDMGINPYGTYMMDASGGFTFNGSIFGGYRSADGGIIRTETGGLNYQDDWGKKTSVEMSYLANRERNDWNNILSRRYFLGDQSDQIYTEKHQGRSTDLKHKGQIEVKSKLDSVSELTWNGNIEWTDRLSNSQFNSQTQTLESIFLSSMNQQDMDQNRNWSLRNDLRYRRRFQKKGRSIRIALSQNYNPNTGLNALASLNRFSSREAVVQQQQQMNSQDEQYGGDLSYTEALGKKHLFTFGYRFNWSANANEQPTLAWDPIQERYSILQLPLSSELNTTRTTQNGRLDYSYQITEKMGLSLGLTYQLIQLLGEQRKPYTTSINRNFEALLPHLHYYWQYGKQSRVSIYYMSSASPPGFSNLQAVVDNRNPLLQRAGNPDLDQQYTHRLWIHTFNRWEKQKISLYTHASGTINQNSLSSQIIVPQRDTLIFGSIPLSAGTQLSQVVNLGTWYNWSAGFGLSKDLKFWESSLDLDLDLVLRQAPSQVNGLKSQTLQQNINPRLDFNATPTENFEFSLSYGLGFNQTLNNLRPETNNLNLNHQLYGDLKWTIFKKLTLSSSIRYQYNTNLAQGINPQIILWNASLSYGLLKNEQLKLKITAFDLLNQNRAVGRNMVDNYIEDYNHQILSQYVMFTLSYNLRYFDKPKPQGGGDIFMIKG
jgi:hypothetical protein